MCFCFPPSFRRLNCSFTRDSERPILLNLSNLKLSVRFFLYLVFNEHSFVIPDVVGSSGLEPPTSCLSGTRSNLLSYEPVDFLTQPAPLGLRSSISSPLVAFATGGDEGNRTLDPLLAGQVLSQLSYTPILLGLKSLKIEQQLLLLFVFSLCRIRAYFHTLTFSIERR